MISDNKRVTLENMTNHEVGYTLTTSNAHRAVIPGTSIIVKASEVRELNYEPGGHYMLLNLLRIKDKELAQEIGVSDDCVEYWWTKGDIDEVLTSTDDTSVNRLLDALEFGPSGISDFIVSRAIDLETSDMRKLNGILKYTGIDVATVIRNKHVYEQQADSPNVQSPRRHINHRRVAV